jgi:hypothetical protein
VKHIARDRSVSNQQFKEQGAQTNTVSISVNVYCQINVIAEWHGLLSFPVIIWYE